MTEGRNIHSLTEGGVDQLLIRNSPSVTRVDIDNDIEAGDWDVFETTIHMLAS